MSIGCARVGITTSPQKLTNTKTRSEKALVNKIVAVPTRLPNGWMQIGCHGKAAHLSITKNRFDAIQASPDSVRRSGDTNTTAMNLAGTVASAVGNTFESRSAGALRIRAAPLCLCGDEDICTC